MSKINIYQIGGAIFCLAIWEIFAQGLNNSLLAPKLEAIFFSLVDILKSKESYQYIGVTLWRVFLTILIDGFLAFIFGLFAGLNKKVEAFFFTTENVFRSIPTIAILLLSLIWFKSNITPIFVASLIVFPILYRNLTDGIKSINYNLRQVSIDFCVPFFKQLIWFYIPSVKPFIKNAFSLSLGFSIKVVVMAEVLSQPKYGIGVAFQIAKNELDIAKIFAWSFIVIFLAIFLQNLFKIKK